MTTLNNGTISIKVNNHGAELCSIKVGTREYLWQAYPEFWKRSSPVLFPIVGSVWQGEYRIKGKTYQLGQHGIARDMDFELAPQPLSRTLQENQLEDEVWFQLKSSEETLSRYPYPFILSIGYRIHDKSIDVMWKVENSSDNDIYFQIGAHPAFYWPLFTDKTINEGVEAMNKVLTETDDRGYFALDATSNILRCSVIRQGGCVDADISKLIVLDEGYLPLDTNTFNQDALIIEENQVKAVTLCDNKKKPYITINFDSPLIGLWSPPNKNAPFVCIEPWYGRTDEVGYTGDYENKPWIQHLNPLGTFETKYTITIH